MNDLLETEFFRLLAESPSEASNKKMQNVYGQFVEQVKNIGQSETDFSVIFRTLNVTRIELAALEFLHRYESGEKCA